MLTHTDNSKSSSVAKVNKNKNPAQIRAHEGTGELNVIIQHYNLLAFCVGKLIPFYTFSSRWVVQLLSISIENFPEQIVCKMCRVLSGIHHVALQSADLIIMIWWGLSGGIAGYLPIYHELCKPFVNLREDMCEGLYLALICEVKKEIDK